MSTEHANATDSEVPSGTTDASETVDSVGAGDASALDAESLVLGYPNAPAPVIDGESIAAEPGAVTALVGPNGSGKSTLLKGLATQLAPDDGSVMVDGRDVHAMDTKALARKLGLLAGEHLAEQHHGR